MNRFNQHEKGVRQHEPNPACQHDRTQYRTPLLVEADGEVLGASYAVIGVSDKKLRRFPIRANCSLHTWRTDRS
jgi:hypothetical protein